MIPFTTFYGLHYNIVTWTPPIGNVLLRSRNSPLHSTRFKDQLIPRKRVNVKAGLTAKFESRVDVTYVLTKMNARFNGHRVLNKGRRC